MSEYQYYEFQAVDRPLTAAEQAALRAISTRAEITARHFVNEYTYGDLKGDPDVWMERYFDAHVYLANWGTHQLQLRFPEALLPALVVKPFACPSLKVRTKGGFTVLKFWTEDEEGDEWTEGEAVLGSVLPVRAELAAGDLRALYLGWLSGTVELDDDAEEPPVPPGLGSLSPALEALADFLRVDRDLLAAAAALSAKPSPRPSAKEKREWIAALPLEDKNVLLTQLLSDEAPQAAATLQRRFLAEHRPAAKSNDAPRRTVADLRAEAEAMAAARADKEARAEAAEKQRRELEAAEARTKYLDTIAGTESRLWEKVELLILERLPRSYDQAVEMLKDLRDLAARNPDPDFAVRVAKLRSKHEQKRRFIERLDRDGLGRP